MLIGLPKISGLVMSSEHPDSPSSLKSDELFFWKAACASLKFSPCIILIAALAVLACLLFNLAGYDQAATVAEIVSLAISVPVAISALALFYKIPQKRFGSHFRDEYICQPMFPVQMRGTAVSVRCPRWMKGIVWAYIVVELVVLLMLGLTGIAGPNTLYEFVLTANPVLFSFGAITGAYATMHALMCESVSRGKPKV